MTTSPKSWQTPTYFHRHTDGYTYICELKPSQKLRCSRMITAITPYMPFAARGDFPVPLKTVPLAIRRAARQHLGVAS
jgi:hypothetical protein